MGKTHELRKKINAFVRAIADKPVFIYISQKARHADMKCRIGIDVGGTKIAYGLFNEQYELIHKIVTPSMPEAEPDIMIGHLAEQVSILIREVHAEPEEIEGVGAVFPGHIDYAHGMVMTCANLPKWKNVFVRKELEQRLRCPVFVDNDANVGALAEAKLGKAAGKENLIYVTISTGIGGGLYLNGQIVRGSYGAAGELGHMQQDAQCGIRCGCGRIGCVESVASGTGMARYTKIRIIQGEPSIMPELAGGLEQITSYHVGVAAKQGDKLALEILDYAAMQLARFFLSLYQIFNVDTVVYGGGVTKIGPLLMDQIREKFLALTPLAHEYPMDLIPTSFDDSIGMIGAALLVE